MLKTWIERKKETNCWSHSHFVKNVNHVIVINPVVFIIKAGKNWSPLLHVYFCCSSSLILVILYTSSPLSHARFFCPFPYFPVVLLLDMVLWLLFHYDAFHIYYYRLSIPPFSCKYVITSEYIHTVESHFTLVVIQKSYIDRFYRRGERGNIRAGHA